MTATNPFFVIFPIFSCLLTVWLIKKNSFDASTKGRFATIDGLRGYLAFFVFLHHSCVNYFYLTTGKWQSPNSSLFGVFGYGSVQVFFMITSFLFFSKLLNIKQTKINWVKFYISRLLRLYPLYLFSISLVFIIIMYLSKGHLQESYWELFKHVSSWILFGLFGMADINEEARTHIINAGVTWSLSYEWIFYLSMPIWAHLLKLPTSIRWVLFGLIGVSVIGIFHPLLGGKAFLGGILAAILVKNDEFRLVAASNLMSVVAMLALIAAAVPFVFNNESLTLILLIIAFVIIACGNQLFGLLLHPISRALGDLSYSIYLLHGILLFVTFNILIDKSLLVSANMYWGVITIIAPILIFICHCTYQYIEHPAMKSTDKVMIWLKKIVKKNDQETQSYSA